MASKVTKLFKPEAGTVHWLNGCVERGKREVFSEITTMTPALANIILGMNPDNRHIRATKMMQYAADMRGGRWAFNGEPIIVAKDGSLNDGQHRLGAIIEANVTLPLLFVFGVSRETRTTVDQGAARTAADYLSMKGVQHAAQAASIGRLVIAFERSGGQDVAQSKFITNAEVLARVEGDPQIISSAQFAQSHAKSTKTFCAPSSIGACHYLLSAEHPADAATYMEQVCVGENLRRTDPAFAVRERLWTTGKYPGQKMEVIFRGWTAYRSSRPLKLVKVLGSFPALV